MKEKVNLRIYEPEYNPHTGNYEILVLDWGSLSNYDDGWYIVNSNYQYIITKIIEEYVYRKSEYYEDIIEIESDDKILEYELDETILFLLEQFKLLEYNRTHLISLELQNILDENNIYFYESIWDYIDKDFTKEDIYNFGVKFGSEPDKKYFGFLSYDSELYGFETEDEMIKHLDDII